MYSYLFNVNKPTGRSFEEPLLSVNSEETARQEKTEQGSSDAIEDNQEKDSVEAPVQWSRLLALASHEWGWIGLGLGSLALRLPFNLAMPHFISLVLAATLRAVHLPGERQHDLHQIQVNMVYFLIAALANAVLDFFNWNFFVIAQQRIIRRLRGDVVRSLLSQEVGFFDSVSSGELISRLTADVGEVANNLTWVFRWSLEAVVRVGGISLYLFWVSWRLALLAWVLAPLIALINRLYGDWLQKNSQLTQKALAEANEVAHEALSCFRTVFSFANESLEHRRYMAKVEDYYQVSVRQGVLDGVYFMAISCFLMQTVLQGGVLVGGVVLVMRGQMDSDKLIATMFYQSQLMEYMNNLLNVFTNMYKSSGAASKVFALLDRKPKRCPPSPTSLDPFPSPFFPTPYTTTTTTTTAAATAAATADDSSVTPGSCGFAATSTVVELRDVHFHYPTRPQAQVLQGVSLKVPEGAVVALVGGSGAGKSTIFHLIEHFYQPQSGQVLLSGVEVKNIGHSLLHRLVGIVGQEPVLFRCSIAENILYSAASAEPSGEETVEVVVEGHQEGPDDRGQMDPRVEGGQAVDPRVEAAARVANAHNFITALPHGYDTQVGERGVALSGGQKQRVAIARALLQDPRLLLLDEATSALDTESEALVQEALEHAMRGRSVMVIAHRLSTIKNADFIVVMDKGRVVETGSHAELLAKGNPISSDGFVTYSTLVARQTAD